MRKTIALKSEIENQVSYYRLMRATSLCIFVAKFILKIAVMS